MHSKEDWSNLESYCTQLGWYQLFAKSKTEKKNRTPLGELGYLILILYIYISTNVVCSFIIVYHIMIVMATF